MEYRKTVEISMECYLPKSMSREYRAVLALFILILSVLFFIGGPLRSLRSVQEAWNLGHIIYFSLLPLLLQQFPGIGEIRSIRQAGFYLGFTVVVGLLVELLQHGVNRSVDIGDMFRNLIGAGVALCFILPAKKTVPVQVLRILQMIIIFAIAYQCVPTVMALRDEFQARKAFPVLADFETSLQKERWSSKSEIRLMDEEGNLQNSVLLVKLTTDKYTGASLNYFPANWEGYDSVQFRINNIMPASLRVICRIHDRQHEKGAREYADRFNKGFDLVHGWNTITIDLDDVRNAPQERKMNLGKMRNLHIFAVDLKNPREIYIDDVKLLKNR